MEWSFGVDPWSGYWGEVLEWTGMKSDLRSSLSLISS